MSTAQEIEKQERLVSQLEKEADAAQSKLRKNLKVACRRTAHDGLHPILVARDRAARSLRYAKDKLKAMKGDANG